MGGGSTTALKKNRPLVDLFRAAAGEAAVTVRSACWPVSKLVPLPAGDPGCPLPRVVMVHGFLAHREVLRPLARRLLEEGWAEPIRVGYPTLRFTVDDIAARIAEVVDGIEGQVDVIGHSMGAVAARYWIKKQGGAARVRRFVSLAGPHAGTGLWRVAPQNLRPALDPGGRFVESMAEGPEPVPTAVIRASHDSHVFPPERGRIRGIDEVVVQAAGHNGLLWSRDAHDAVVAFLRA